ncbi:NAD+ kinase [Chitinivorax tropicus]|uniref:NAD kinase n=1 Tax=Chitinivorax tropicus TaxID=714531 RepID=A0A840MPR9_9PROT|nr:NAD kinase [Chitinivorax tropicus]MBB5018476.1 NAD+ kinase [Chitinivorax tropicus]
MTSLFKKVALVARHGKPEIITSMLDLAGFLAEDGVVVLFDDQSIDADQAAGYQRIERDKIGRMADLVVVLGGDGTMLSVARLIAPYRIPLVGINQGRLGFMTDIPLHEMKQSVAEILKGEFIPEERILLEATLYRNGQEITKGLAFNDVVFSRGATGSMIEFEIFVDDQFVYSQRSDGLIVSTPTGSTAYSLASGGPILHPTVPAITLVPICPQSLSNRPIAINDGSVVEFILTRGQDARVHFDNQSHNDLHELDRVVIRRYRNSLRILHPMNYSYYDMLRHKLHWGEKLL